MWPGARRTKTAPSRCRSSPPKRPPTMAKELGKKCRDLGLEPLMMFSGIYPKQPAPLTS